MKDTYTRSMDKNVKLSDTIRCWTGLAIKGAVWDKVQKATRTRLNDDPIGIKISLPVRDCVETVAIVLRCVDEYSNTSNSCD